MGRYFVISGLSIIIISYYMMGTVLLARKAAGLEIKFKQPKKKSDADLRPTDAKKGISVKWRNELIKR